MLSSADKEALWKAGTAAIWTFIVLFLTAFLGWMGDVMDWLTEEAVEFPDPGLLVTAAASAIIAAFTFVGAALVSVASVHLKSGQD